MTGFLEALDKALTAMKKPKDILFLDVDNHGQWKVINKDQLRKL